MKKNTVEFTQPLTNYAEILFLMLNGECKKLNVYLNVERKERPGLSDFHNLNVRKNIHNMD